MVLALGCAWTARHAESAVATERPETLTVARGERVFKSQCLRCHASGDMATADGLQEGALPDFLIRLQVRRGLGAMPAFPARTLADADLDDLVAYLMAMRQKRLSQ